VGEEHVVAAQLRSPRLPLISSLLPHDTEPTELMVARHLLFAGMHECRDGLRARLLVVPCDSEDDGGTHFRNHAKARLGESLDEVECGLCDLEPAVVDCERVPAVGDPGDLGD
jgi:hypothetical protein